MYLYSELRGEVSQMICVFDNKVPTAVDRYKLLLPPNYTHYFIWGFPDHSARIANVETDKVGNYNREYVCA